MKKKRHGYSLAEMLAVITIMGVLASGIYAGWGYVQEAADEKDAKVKANAINSGKIALSTKYDDATSRWDACASDAERYALLRSNNLLPMSPADYTQYVPKRINFTLQGINERTTITLKSDGSEVAY